MAKVVNGGNKKGKVGSSIFYTIKNSNNKVTQGERIYQPNVTNPQSESQRAQRMKMTPASNFYRALSGILDHSWEGVKYGAMSRQYFMKLAMSANQEIFPYVNKGTTFVVPGPYPISRGSLPSIGWSIYEGEILIDIPTEDFEGTLGNFSSLLLQKNTFLRNGDQITFIAFYDLEDREQRTYIPVVTRVLLDTQSADSMIQALGSSWDSENINSKLGIAFNGFSETATLAGACVVVSRKNESGGQVWQRSTEVMAVTNELLNEWMSPAAYAGALDSYKRSESVSDSDYYLNDAETESEAGSGSANYSFTNGSIDFTLGGTTETHTAVIVQNDNGPLLTCAKFGVYEDERPDQKNAWLETYIVRGRTIVQMDRYNLKAADVQSITAKYDNQTIQVLTPEAFVARFKDFSIA